MTRHATIATNRSGRGRDDMLRPAFTLPGLAVVLGSSSWLDFTLVAVFSVVALGIVSSLLLYVGNRLRWLDHSTQIRLKRTLHVGFGALLLGSVTLPYLLVEVPMVAASFLVLALLIAIPYLVTAPNPDSKSERATQENPELES